MSALIWLLRHGEAEGKGEDDSSRRLTADGERQARAAGVALSRLGIAFDACLTSPKARARETARIACEELDVRVEETPALRGGDFDAVELAAGRSQVLLVGHEPDLSRAAQLLTGSAVELKKGGLLAIEGGVLVLELGPGKLRAIAERAALPG